MVSRYGKSEVSIGPLSYSYEVQDVSLQEQKSVEPLQATRTNKNFLSETGTGIQKAIIRLFFTDVQAATNLDKIKKLIALFRVSPIVSIYNELISTSWNEDLGKLRGSQEIIPESDRIRKYFPYVPVSLEELSISSVPDIPYAFYVTLVVGKIDITSVYRDNILLYLDEDGNATPWPEDAFYLSRAIDLVSRSIWLSDISPDDFGVVRFNWIGQYATGEDIVAPFQELSYMSIGDKKAVVVSEQASIKNIFSYNTLIGRGAPFVQHMGSTSIYHSIDIMFTEQDANTDPEFKHFCLFKESSDYIARARERLTRVAGWEVTSPVLKLLSNSYSNYSANVKNPILVPLNVNIDTAGLPPGTKAVRIDLVETSYDIFTRSETSLLRGGSDYAELKRYFEDIIKNEYIFRSTMLSDPIQVAKAVSGLSGPGGIDVKVYDDFSLFWPIVNNVVRFSTNEIFGLLNKDSLMAVFLDSTFDKSARLQIALEENLVIAGKAVTGNRLPNVFTRFSINLQAIEDGFEGPDPANTAYKTVYGIISDYVKTKMFDTSSLSNVENLNFDKFAKIIAARIFVAFFGNYDGVLEFTGQSGTAVQELSQSRYKFSKEFTDALFSVIVKRLGPPSGVPRAYYVDGLMSAFLKLHIKYVSDGLSNPDVNKVSDKDVSTAVNNYFRTSVYEDIPLPTYVDLFGDRWTEFAPTYGDVGLVNTSTVSSSPVRSDSQQKQITVDQNDPVSPYAWFYVERYKDKLLAQLSDVSSSVSILGSTLHLSIPFNVSDIDEIEKEYKDQIEKQKNNTTYKSESLPGLISRALEGAKLNDSKSFQEGLDQLSKAAGDKYYDEFVKSNKRIALYVHQNGNIIGRSKLSSPGLAKEIYRVASDTKILRPTDRLPRVADAGYRSADRTDQFEFVRSLDSNTRNMIESDLNQMPELYESPAKFFPALKVYLLEKRGSELFGDSSFFNVNPVISVDITLDKDDADLAVIKIADPLFILQREFFPVGNIVTTRAKDGTTDIRQVLGSLRGANSGGYLKSYKIVEGRPVQIRMGYEAQPNNLKIVFTGKIVEIQPGDVLTIVCQSWKNELINRQVSFYNDNTKNWGARDLVTMAVQRASPEGIGDFYPQLTTDFILKNMTDQTSKDIVSKILRQQTDVDTLQGARGVGGAITNYVYESLSLESSDQFNKGLDLRLKNVWWPDLPSVNNLLGWRSWLNILPSQYNDGWIIPLQTSWDAVKEASRHAWNTIVQVVPYDGEATLFFGHPDQPYYFTKGTTVSKERWAKYYRNKKNRQEKAKVLISAFFTSEQYTNDDFTRGKQSFVPGRSFDSGTTAIVAGVPNYNLDFTPNSTEVDRRNIYAKDIPTDQDIFTNPASVLLKIANIIKIREARASNGDTQDVPRFINVPGSAGTSSFIEELKPSYKLVEFLAYGNLTRVQGPKVSEEIQDTLSVTSVLGVSDVNNVSDYNTYGIYDVIDKSYLPSQAFSNLKEKLGYRATSILVSAFWNIPEENISIVWPNFESDVQAILLPRQDIAWQNIDAIGQRIAETSIKSNKTFFTKTEQFLQDGYRDLVDAFIAYDSYLERIRQEGSISYGANYSEKIPGAVVPIKYASAGFSSPTNNLFTNGGARLFAASFKEFYLANESNMSADQKQQFKLIDQKVKEIDYLIGSAIPRDTKKVLKDWRYNQGWFGYYNFDPGEEIIIQRRQVGQIRLALESLIDIDSREYRRQGSVGNTLLSKLKSDEGFTTNQDRVNLASLESAEDIYDNIVRFKIFVYFFNEYMSKGYNAMNEAQDVLDSGENELPPNMQVFRQHHYIDSSHDIIKNNIVASTKDMWNTVVLEYPAVGESEARIDNETDLYKQGEFYSGIKWVYWPKNEISGVVGLQFHPGLTLANKKIKVFTELNCQTEELAAKLAITHLADGIRRMYRGSLLVTGRIIKPHDRVILSDEYNQMFGPIEVESVVHHWSVETGWVSNISPQAVCDANPGAAILQTAAIEDAFAKVFTALDYAEDILLYAAIIATIASLGTAAPEAAAAEAGGAAAIAGIRAGVAATIKGLASKGRTKFVADLVKNNIKAIGTGFGDILASKGNPFALLRSFWKSRIKSIGLKALGGYTALDLLKQGSHQGFRLWCTSSYIEASQKAEQLPVILTPLYFNSQPFLAGMETDDPVWAINFNDVFWSLRDFNQGAEYLLQNLGFESYSDLDSNFRQK
jgi:hypothetical protein